MRSMAVKIIKFCTILVMLLLLSLSGCGYLDIAKQDDVQPVKAGPGGKAARPEYNSAVVMGKLASVDGRRYPAAIVAYAISSSGGTVADYVFAGDAGVFMLYLPAGRYRLYAACDFNGDASYDEKEICGVYGASPDAPGEISLQDGVVVNHVTIGTSRELAGRIKTPGNLRLREDAQTIRQRGSNGEVVKIYDERFSPDNARSGWWNPTSFMKAFGARIYMLEPYDPRKIPVLFVHGARGTPQDWVYFLIRMDRNKYQPWFYYYPSGIRLSLATHLLYENLAELHKRYGFRKMGIAAHSVGGIARSLLVRYDLDEKDSYVKLYATFATPWTGFPMADIATSIPQKKIPVWFDVGTQSPFISRTLDARLAPWIHHYIFYGRYDRVTGDGAVDKRVAMDAKAKLPFDCTHDSILSDRKVFRKFSEVMKKEL